MAHRPVYVPSMRAPYVKMLDTEFTWSSGQAVSQKQKNIRALHGAYGRRFPGSKVLEISTKSLQELGVKMSAFNLKKYVPQLDTSIPVECVYHGGKVFSNGGPYTDLYEGTARAAKKDLRLKESGYLKGFYFDGMQISISPKTAFYDWIYINAILENIELAGELIGYDAFTDIEFNPAKSINCQARAAAMFVALAKQNLIEKCRDFDTFLNIIQGE